MYEETKAFEVVEKKEETIIFGRNLQASGLPITFDSLGKMWEIDRASDPTELANFRNPEDTYGICLNKVPDYLTGREVTAPVPEKEKCIAFTIPAGYYLKVTFNGENFEDLVGKKMMDRMKEAKKWAKENKVKLNASFQVEVYAKEGLTKTYPEMFYLFPVQ